jgi:hypothetical protein
MAGSRHLVAVLAAALSLLQLSSAQSSAWLNPDSSRPIFSQSYHNTDAIVFSWQGLNSSMSALWLTSFDTSNSYALRIAANINITNAGTYPWTVTVNETEIDIDDRFRLRFIPTGTTYQSSQSDQFASPGFLLLQRGETAPASDDSPSSSAATVTESVGSSASTYPSASSSSAPPTASASEGSTGLSAGVTIGAAIAALVSVIVIVVLVLWVVRLRRRVNAASNHRSAGIIVDPGTEKVASATTNDAYTVTAREKRDSGLHEVLGDRRQPTELSADMRKPNLYYELAG